MKIYEMKMIYPSGFSNTRFIQPGTDNRGRLEPIGFPSEMHKGPQLIDSMEQAMKWAMGAYPLTIDYVEREYPCKIIPLQVHDTDVKLSQELIEKRIKAGKALEEYQNKMLKQKEEEEEEETQELEQENEDE